MAWHIHHNGLSSQPSAVTHLLPASPPINCPHCCRNSPCECHVQIMPVFQSAIDRMRAAGVNFVSIDLTNVLSSPGSLYPSLSAFEPGREFSRYLYTHNYTISVKAIYDLINSPSTAARAVPSLGFGLDTPEGNVDTFTDYLGRGKASACCCCQHFSD